VLNSIYINSYVNLYSDIQQKTKTQKREIKSKSEHGDKQTKTCMGREQQVKSKKIEENKGMVNEKGRRTNYIILCAVKACIIMFSPHEVEPMVWPSFEKARDLLDGFFALPDIKKKKKQMSLEMYLKEKTKKVHEQFMKTQRKHMDHVTDQLMVELHRGRRLDDLDLSEINALISFSRENIILLRKELEFVQHSPLGDPRVPPFEAQFEELTTIANDVFVRGGQVDERAWKNYEATKRVSIGNALRGNQSHYLVDKWLFASPKPREPTNQSRLTYQTIFYTKEAVATDALIWI